MMVVAARRRVGGAGAGISQIDNRADQREPEAGAEELWRAAKLSQNDLYSDLVRHLMRAHHVEVRIAPAALNLTSLPADGAIVWGNRSAKHTVTVFTDFRCSYCRALTNVLRSMEVKVVERPISVGGMNSPGRSVAE